MKNYKNIKTKDNENTIEDIVNKESVINSIKNRSLNDEEILYILKTDDIVIFEILRKEAALILDENYGDEVYIRGLIEFSNYCKEDCYYCGIRRSNKEVERFRLSKDEILECAKKGYELGFRTFVLQGGEDVNFTDDDFIFVIKKIKEEFGNVRITLSLGIKEYETLKKFKEVGADRYLLRHETYNRELFSYLHPKEQSLDRRVKMLYDLKSLGYVVGTGFLIGPPGHNVEDYLLDIKFLKELKPEMIGIGPFIPQDSTPFKNEKQGDLLTTLKLISILRILFNKALIPSTTALNTIDKNGRILGIKHGANVLMPNLSPGYAKKNYKLYNKKAYNNLEAAEHIKELNTKLKEIGKRIVVGVGDPKRGK